MISFLLRKFWKNKWLMVCLILGNIILVGVVTAVPLFTAATMQRVFQEDFRYIQENQNTFPATMQLRYNFGNAPEDNHHAHYMFTRDYLWPQAVAQVDIPAMFELRTYFTRWSMGLVEPRELPDRTRFLQLVGTHDYENHIRLLHGRLPQSELINGNIIEAIATDWAMHTHNLLVGELMDVRFEGEAEPLFVKVVGIYEIYESSGAFWSMVPLSFSNALLVSPDLIYERFIINYTPNYNLRAYFTMVLDFEYMHAAQVPHYQDAILSNFNRFNSADDTWRYSVSFNEVLERHETQTYALAITIWVLQAPVFVLLALFMYMVTRQILLMDKNEISILKSRGVSRLQIMGIYAAQGLVVGLMSLPFGLALGVALCNAIGSSSGFLDMVARAALDVRITGAVVSYALAASFVSFLYMLLPVIKFSKVTIVEHKQDMLGKNAKKPIWQRFYLDVLTFVFSLYVLYNFRLQSEMMMAVMPETRSFDPLIFLSSSLFIIGAGLLCLRLYPYLVKLALWAKGGRFNPSLYISMLKVSRSAGQEQIMMLFLVFTVAVGVFSAQSARTINLDNAHRIKYLAGADLILSEFWHSNNPAFGGDPFGPPPTEARYFEPNFARFTHFDEVEAITRVMSRYGTLRMGRNTISDLSFMGIDTDSFGETVWFRDDLLPAHINHFLNALAARPDGVLLSSNFRTDLGFYLGDVVSIVEVPSFGRPSSGRFVVVGFVDYWPGFNTVERTVLDTGEIRTQSQFLAVVNRGFLTANWGVRPYQIWMRTNSPTNQFIYDFISEYNIRVTAFYDTSRSLTEILSDPIVQSTNGVLTINFVMTLLLCFSGFIMFWILSIKGRLLQFGIFRAMGMGSKGVIGILLTEQALVTLSALVIGGVIGEVTARTFVPLVQISYTAADQVVPLLITRELRDYLALYTIMGFMVLLCITILTIYTSRVDVSQVLKLGED